jgi:hypothetical protein
MLRGTSPRKSVAHHAKHSSTLASLDGAEALEGRYGAGLARTT